MQVLERIMGLLESSDGSLVLLEKGDVKAIPRHPNFRLIAAMNPATDAGKRHLPPQIRSHFTELYVCEAEQESDLVRVLIQMNFSLLRAGRLQHGVFSVDMQ